MIKLNKKGFTLVEIISVISILSLIIIVVATKGFGAFNNAKNTISEENKKAIYEAANVLMTEVKNCEGNDDIFDNLIGYFLSEETDENKTCEKLIEKAKSDECLNIKLEYLISEENNYITSSGVKDFFDENKNYAVKGCLDAIDNIAISDY